MLRYPRVLVYYLCIDVVVCAQYGIPPMNRILRNWVVGVQNAKNDAYLGDPCEGSSHCLVPHSVCIGNGDRFWTRQKFCICRSGYHPSTGYCDKNPISSEENKVDDVPESTTPSALFPAFDPQNTQFSLQPPSPQGEQLYPSSNSVVSAANSNLERNPPSTNSGHVAPQNVGLQNGGAESFGNVPFKSFHIPPKNLIPTKLLLSQDAQTLISQVVEHFAKTKNSKELNTSPQDPIEDDRNATNGSSNVFEKTVPEIKPVSQLIVGSAGYIPSSKAAKQKSYSAAPAKIAPTKLSPNLPVSKPSNGVASSENQPPIELPASITSQIQQLADQLASSNSPQSTASVLSHLHIPVPTSIALVNSQTSPLDVTQVPNHSETDLEIDLNPTLSLSMANSGISKSELKKLIEEAAERAVEKYLQNFFLNSLPSQESVSGLRFHKFTNINKRKQLL